MHYSKKIHHIYKNQKNLGFKKEKEKSYRDTRRGIYLFNGAESYCLICHKRSKGTKQVDVVI